MEATFFLSNRSEKLKELLERQLFSLNSDPFSERLLVIASREIKNDLFLSLEEKATALNTYFINQAMEYVTKRCYDNEKIEIPSTLELTLKILTLLDNEPHLALPAQQKSKLYAAYTFAKEMMTYGSYGQERDVREVKGIEQPLKRARLRQAAVQEWQVKIYQELFGEKNPYQAYSLLKEPNEVPLHSIHLFGFCHLAPYQLQFFQKIATKVPLFFYIHSPSSGFWGDAISANEMERVLSKRDKSARLAFEKSFLEQNPLLGEWGAILRKFLNHLIEKEVNIEECFDEVEEKNVLTALQGSILDNQPIAKLNQDESLSFHTFPNRWREMEGIYQLILSLVKEKGIEPSDILVMAPDISPYLPYVEGLFSENLGYRLVDVPLKDCSEALDGLSLLLSLEERRFDKESILKLFSMQSFCRKFMLDEKESLVLREWVEKANVVFGYNPEHIKELLNLKEIPEVTHSWKEGIERLIYKFAETSEIDFSSSDLLLKFITILDELFCDLAFSRDKEKRELKQWGHWLESLYEKYFEDSSGELKRALQIFQKPINANLLDFASFHFLFCKFIAETKSSKSDANLQAITFSSLSSSRLISKKVIVLIGMNESAIPRKTMPFALDFIKESDMKAFPSPTDLDRFTFLETLLSAREYLLISSVKNEDEGALVSPLVSLLMSVTGLDACDHPDFPIDSRYFGGDLLSYSKRDFELAEKLLITKEEKTEQIKNKTVKKIEKPLYFDIKELKAVTRFPLRLFFREQHQVDIGFEPNQEREAEFSLAPWQRSRLRLELMEEPLETVLDRARREGLLPQLGLFSLTKEELIREAKEIQEKIALYSPKSKSLSSIELTPTVSEPHVDNKRILLPPMRLVYRGQEILLIGKIDNIAERGLFLFERAEIARAIRHLPSYLLFQNAAIEGEKNFLFARDGKVKEPLKNPEKLLETLLDLYFYAKENPLFLYPHLVGPLLKKEREKIAIGLLECDEEAWQLAKQREWIPSALEFENRFFPLAERLYQEVIDGWF